MINKKKKTKNIYEPEVEMLRFYFLHIHERHDFELPTHDDS